MGFFNKKEKKNKNKGMGNDIINQLALQEALRELKLEKKKNEDLNNSLATYHDTEMKIKEICQQSKTSKIAKAILKELGE